MISTRVVSLFARLSAVAGLLVLALATAPRGSLQAQTGKVITILMLDGKTGKPIVPSNYIVRLDHRDAIRNEALQVDDDGGGKVTVPADASFLAVQGTYRNSMDIYINCDAGMEKDTSTLHWYSITDIMNSGVSTPNECYKGKYADATRVPAKPSQFVIYVRAANWRESQMD